MKIISKFKVTHLRNLIVRVVTKDKYYVCEECHHIHKRDGNELRLDKNDGLMSHYLWYGSVSRSCFINQQINVKKALKKELQETWSGMTHETKEIF